MDRPSLVIRVYIFIAWYTSTEKMGSVCLSEEGRRGEEPATSEGDPGIMQGHTARDEAEFGGGLEKVGPKGERPAGRLKSSKGIEEGSVRPAAVGAKRGTGFKRVKRRARED